MTTKVIKSYQELLKEHTKVYELNKLISDITNEIHQEKIFIIMKYQ